MRIRKWLVRGLVLAVVVSATGAGLLYQRWTSPTVVRQQVLEHLNRHFIGANVSIESAHMRLLGGTAVSELRMCRKDETDRIDFVYIPSAIIYHDKEKLLDGELNIRKIELQRPRFRVIRNRDGTWNMMGILGPVDPNKPIPTIVVHQGTIVLEDRQADPGTPPVEIKDLNLTVVNDPRPTLVFEGSGKLETGGVIQVSGKWQRNSGDAVLTLEAVDIPVGPAVVQRLTGFCPELGAHCRQLEGVGRVKVGLTYHPDTPQPWSHDVHLQLSQGKLSHPALPMPLHHMETTLHLVNGQVMEAKARALCGDPQSKNPCLATLDVKQLVPCSCQTLEGMLVKQLDLRVEHLPVTQELFTHLPLSLQKFQNEFSPSGPLTISVSIRNESSGQWHRHLILQPEGEEASAESDKFRYRLEHLSGIIEHDAGSNQEPEIKVNLVGYAAGQPVHIRGGAKGEEPGAAVALDIWGDNVRLDERLIRALPPEFQDLARSFSPTGLGNFQAYIRRAPQTEQFANRFIVTFHDATMCYDEFRYPLEDVSGVLDIQPGHWEFRDFRGTHKGGEFRTQGHSQPGPDGDHIFIDIKGTNILLDDELKEALKEDLKKTWNIFSPSGRIDFEGKVECLAGKGTRDEPSLGEVSRGGLTPRRSPNKPPEIDLTIYPRDCSVRPAFFKWTLDGLHGAFVLNGKSFTSLAGAGLPDAVLAKLKVLKDQLFETREQLCAELGKIVARDELERFQDLVLKHAQQGKIRYAKNWITLEKLRARHGDSVIGLEDGTVYCKPGGGAWVELIDLWANPLRPDEEFANALPPGLQKGFRTLQFKDAVTFKTAMVIDAPPEPNILPVVYWDGWVGLNDATVQMGIPIQHITGQIACRGRHNGQQLEGVIGNLMLKEADIFNQPLREIHSQIEVTKDAPEILRLPGLQARFFGGEVYGPLRVEFGPTLRYELRLSASQINLEEFGRHNFDGKVRMSGQAAAALHLVGEGSDLHGLQGNGTVDVPSGKMYNLPLLLDLLKVLGLRPPDRTAFEEAHARFTIQGPRARVTQLDLIGNAISLRGLGELNLDGTDLNLDFHVDWARAAQILPPGIKRFPQVISNQLLKLEMRGKIGDIHVTKVPMPLVFDPVKRLMTGPER